MPSRRYAGLGLSRPYKDSFDSSTRAMGVASQNSTMIPCAMTKKKYLASLFSWRCLAAPKSSFLHTAKNLRPPSVTVLTHTAAFKYIGSSRSSEQ